MTISYRGATETVGYAEIAFISTVLLQTEDPYLDPLLEQIIGGKKYCLKICMYLFQI